MAPDHYKTDKEATRNLEVNPNIKLSESSPENTGVIEIYEEMAKTHQEAGMCNKLKTGVKHDSFKPDWSFLNLKDLEEVIRVYMLGSQKYERDSWQLLDDFQNRYFSADLRHAADYQEACMSVDNPLEPAVDPEFKTLVSAHMVWNSLALLHRDLEILKKNGKMQKHLDDIKEVYDRLKKIKEDKKINQESL